MTKQQKYDEIRRILKDAWMVWITYLKQNPNAEVLDKSVLDYVRANVKPPITFGTDGRKYYDSLKADLGWTLFVKAARQGIGDAEGLGYKYKEIK